MTRNSAATTRDISLFKQQHQVDPVTGDCIPKYSNFSITTVDKNSPAWQILKDPSRVTEIFAVKDAEGNVRQLSAPWIIGFADGEGTLTIHLNKNAELAGGLQVQPVFIIVQIEADYLLLTAIAAFFGCGSVTVNRADKTSVRYQYRITGIELLRTLFVPFFAIAMLNTKKADEYVVWAECVTYLYKKRHKEDWPNSMVTLLEMAKSLKYTGYPSKKALDYVDTCDRFITQVRASRPPRS